MIMDRLYHRVGEVGPSVWVWTRRWSTFGIYARADRRSVRTVFLFNRSIIDATKDVAAVFRCRLPSMGPTAWRA